MSGGWPVGPGIRVAFARGAPGAVGAAREMARSFLGADHPAADDVVTVASELCSNAVEHTDGAWFCLVLTRTPGSCTVRVQDQGAAGGGRPCFPASPTALTDDPGLLLAVSGRGLAIVATLCPTDHGTRQTEAGSVTWGTVRWGSDA